MKTADQTSEVKNSLPNRAELVLTRVFEAPRDVVFNAWTDPAHVMQWWGPRSFTNPVCEMDVRPGGAILIVMRAPDGTEHPMRGVFKEVVRPQRLVFTTRAEDGEGRPLIDGQATVTFVEENEGRTRVTVETWAIGLGPIAPMMLKGMEAGWTSSLEKLTDLVTPHDRQMAETRIYDAPRELVFDMFTDPEHLTHWWGPTGFSTTTREMDLRPGGSWRFVMHGPDGTDYVNHVVYVEIDRPRRLVYRHEPEPGTEPVRFETTVTFIDLGGKTEVTMRGIFPSAAQWDFVVEKYRADEGLKQTLERLGERLRRA